MCGYTSELILTMLFATNAACILHASAETQANVSKQSMKVHHMQAEYASILYLH